MIYCDDVAMDLKQDEIVVFIELYKKEYNVTLNAEQATEELAKLRQLYKMVYLSPIHHRSAITTTPMSTSTSM